MAISVIPYLGFNGNCKEAVERYISVFGGQIYHISFWGQENCDESSRWGKVMHVEFDLGDTRMSASDTPFQFVNDGAVRLMIHMDGKDEALKAVESLSEGGTILNPLLPHPKPDDSGMGAVVKDKYGYQWIFTCPNPDYREE